MADVLVHLEGAVEKTLQRLVSTGFFKTKSEAIRAGILELGKDYQIIKSREEIMDELAVEKMQRMNAEIRGGRRKALSEEEVARKYGV